MNIHSQNDKFIHFLKLKSNIKMLKKWVCFRYLRTGIKQVRSPYLRAFAYGQAIINLFLPFITPLVGLALLGCNWYILHMSTFNHNELQQQNKSNIFYCILFSYKYKKLIVVKTLGWILLSKFFTSFLCNSSSNNPQYIFSIC